MLEGAAGIGKTTLWRADADVARSAGLAVLTATPAEAERELANVVLGDLLAESLAPVLPERPAPRRRALEAALLLDAGEGTEAGPRELAVAMHSAVRLLAEAQPLVIAVDDVQWTNASSAGALAFALRRLADAPVAWLLGRRTGLALPADLAVCRSRCSACPPHPDCPGRGVHVVGRARELAGTRREGAGR